MVFPSLDRKTLLAALLLHAWLGVVLLVAAAASALADEVRRRTDEPEYLLDGLPERTIATALPRSGDLLGHRRWLAERGVYYNFWYRADVLANVSGGYRRGVVNQGLFEPSLSVDFRRLAGLTGLRLYTNLFLIHNTGRMRRDFIGGINTIAVIEAAPTVRLSELWLEQRLLGGTVRLRGGQLVADADSFFAQTAEIFLQSDWPTIAALSLPSGGPAYPLSTPGLLLALDPGPGVTLQLGVFNGNPAGPGPGDEQRRNRDGLAFRTRDPALVLAEAQVSANQAPGDTRLARTLKLGGWAHLGRFDHQRLAEDGGPLADQAGSGIPLRLRGSWGLYAVGEHQLYRLRGGDAESGVTAFGRASVAPSDRSTISLYLDGGMVLSGLVATRPRDRFGFSMIYARFSDAVRGFDRNRNRLTSNGAVVRDFELNLELTYVAEVLAGFSLQPFLTRIWHPSGDMQRDALVVGFRSYLQF